MGDWKSENPLETALVAAAQDPTRRPAFYRVFLSSDLFVVDERTDQRDEGHVELTAGTQLKLRFVDVEGGPHLPVFSSVTRLRQFVQAETRYLGVRVSDLLSMIRGSALLLNPASEYGKRFSSAEIEALIDGSIFAPQSSRVTTEPEEVQIGQPADYPTHVTEALSRYFRGRRDVRAAYLAHYANPATGEPPHTLIGVDTDGRWEEIAGEAGIVLNDVCRPGELVDFIQLGPSGVSEYLRTTKPFYKKKLLGIF